MFVPTASLALLDIIHGLRPNHSLIAADFDALPDVSVAGTNAPLVAEKVGMGCTDPCHSPVTKSTKGCCRQSVVWTHITGLADDRDGFTQ